MRKNSRRLVEPPARNTILVERREGLWRMVVYPDEVQMFRSRELASRRVPPWTVIVREPETG